MELLFYFQFLRNGQFDGPIVAPPILSAPTMTMVFMLEKKGSVSWSQLRASFGIEASIFEAGASYPRNLEEFASHLRPLPKILEDE